MSYANPPGASLDDWEIVMYLFREGRHTTSLRVLKENAKRDIPDLSDERLDHCVGLLADQFVQSDHYSDWLAEFRSSRRPKKEAQA
ncbi:hypothetical protein ACYPKM_02030 [Pseudomonas aeruginosa]